MKFAVLIVVLVVILLMTCFLRKSHDLILKGGEYEKFTIQDGTSIKPTVSQLSITPFIGRSVLPLDSFNNLLKCSKSQLISRSRAEIKIDYDISHSISDLKDNEVIYCERLDEAHLISDANIDLIGILQGVHADQFRESQNVVYAMAANEWHGNLFRSEQNELITTYESSRDEFIISRQQSYLWLRYPFLTFTAYSPISDHAEINAMLNKIHSIIPEKTFDDFGSFDIYLNSNGSQIQEENTLNYSQKISFLNSISMDTLKSLLEYSPNSPRIRSVLNALQTKHNTKLLLFNAVKTLELALKSMRSTSITHMYQIGIEKEIYESFPTVDIFIEFSYGREPAHMLYYKIHAYTVNLIVNLIVKLLRMTVQLNVKYIFCFRILADKTCSTIMSPGTLKLKKFPETGPVKIYYIIYDQCQYDFAKIPDTQDDFSYDEQIFLNYNKVHYSIQIEHSEELMNHKCNFLEFIGRTFRPICEENDIKLILAQNTKYLGNISQSDISTVKWDEKFIQWKPKTTGMDIKSSIIYKSFGANNNMFNPSSMK